MKAGTWYNGDGHCRFTVWAPEKKTMLLHLLGAKERKLEMHCSENGYFSLELDGIEPGTHYFYMPDGEKDYPDPASHYQPQGVHGPSQVVDHRSYVFEHTNWRTVPFNELIMYELHVGCFTEEGRFESMIPRLKALADIGINAIEIMPVAQCPGNRNWGYDGVFPYAVQHSYGGPDGLKKLVDAAHALGIAVFLDVVYNHLGPEGNYFRQFSEHYFTSHYHVIWGDAINYDGRYCDPVRDFFSDNIIYWFEQYHIDGLRVDAIHSIFDMGAVHFWHLVQEKLRHLRQKLGRPLYLIAEDDRNSPATTKAIAIGGYGFHAQWLDDFHHALYTQLDEKGKKRYEDFERMDQLAKADKEGFVHSGDYVKFRKRRHGASSAGVPGDVFVVFNQNHDQVGNRVFGERLSLLVSFEQLKIAAAALLLSPYIPLLFMGEEYAEEAPFYFFGHYSDPELIKKVREGRKNEFRDFILEGDFPDPQSEQTFTDCKLNWNKRNEGRHRIMLNWNKQLIALRRSEPALHNFNKNNLQVQLTGTKSFRLDRRDENGEHPILCFFNLGNRSPDAMLPPGTGRWIKALDSKDRQWMEEAASVKLLPDELQPEQHILLPPYSVLLYKLKK